MITPPLSLVIPAFNEARRLAANLQALLHYLQDYRPAAELIVVDDGSTDETAGVAGTFFERHPEVPARIVRFEQNRGKGHAVRAGLLAAQAPIALFSDADLSTPITELPKIVEPIENGDYDIVFGSRALDRGLIGERQPWRREQSGKIFNLMVRRLTGLPFYDTQCGFKAFRMETARQVVEQAQINGFGFDVELLYLAQHAGLRQLEVPVRWDHNEGSKVHLMHDSLQMFSEVVNLRRRIARGAPSAIGKAEVSR